ncbi:MAG: hypothetical protein TEF_20485 [Rhizobiales bacterium NRL2]|jgi:hypothetical protein|nr:MAG: hypothetical protein TEF_20485 [Rhizobiales bacterium NRL2]
MARRNDHIAVIAAGIAGFSARRPLLVILTAVLLSALSLAVSGRHLGINTDNFDMISAETPFRQAAIEYRDAFPWYGDQLVVVIDAPTPEQAEIAAAGVMTHMRAQERLFSHVRAPAIDPFLRRNGLLYMEPEQLQDFLDRLAAAQGLLAVLAERPDLVGLLDMLELALEQADPESVQAVQLADLVATMAAMAEDDPDAPAMLSWRRQLAVEGQGGLDGRQIVVAKPVQDFATLSPARAAIEDLRAHFAGYPDAIGFRLTGDAALDTEELDSVKLGGAWAGALSASGILLLLFLGLRGVRDVLAAIAVLAAGLSLSLGFATLTVGQLNLLSVAFAVLFIGLAVDFSIHFTLRARESGRGPAAVRDAGRSVGASLVLSALAAAIGFLSFLPTPYRGLAELGVIAGGSMVIAVALNLTLLPALLTLGVRSREAEPRPPAKPGRRTGRLARPVVALGAVLGMGGAILTPFSDFDFNPLLLKDPESESVATFFELARGDDGGGYALEGLTAGPEAAARAAEALAERSGIGRVLHLGRFIPDNQAKKLAALQNAALFLFPVLTATPAPPPTDAERRQAVDGFDAAVSAAPDSGALNDAARRLANTLQAMDTAGLAAFETRVTGLLPHWLADIRTAFDAGPVTADDAPPDFRQYWVTDDGRYRVQIFPADPIDSNSELRSFAESAQTVLPQATGTPAIVTAAGEAVLDSFRTATVVAAVLVALLIGMVLRHPFDILLTLAPLLLAAVMTLGAAVLLGEALNFANVIVLPLLFGLGVASSIHLVLRRRRLEDPDRLMRSSTPRAVLFSSLTTLASFGGLALAPHLGMASMGRLLTIAIIAILFATLIFLPALIRVTGRSEMSQ